ncbi:hypothetical protein SESBI_09245 [Sesbania bispinosa]|nr:hypothetical protein SESBI_09245 [Sesbania bispinosa]
MMIELFVLGCTGIVVFLHGVHFFFHALTQQHLALRSLSLGYLPHLLPFFILFLSQSSSLFCKWPSLF